MTLETRMHHKVQRLKATSGVSPDEGARLSFLASQVPDDGIVVELGSCWGRSAGYLAAGLAQAGRRKAKVYCVDLWDLGVDTPERHHAPDAFQRFRNNLEYLKLWPYIRAIQADTLTAAADWERPIDLLFVDAGHKYHEVLADYVAWSPFVRPGGVIAFHDYVLPQHPDVVRCVDHVVTPSGLWEPVGVHGRVWSAQRRT